MKLKGLITLIALSAVSLISDLAGMFFAGIGSNYAIPYQLRENLKFFQEVPMGALFFGVLYALTAMATSQDHNKVTKEEVMGYSLLAFLIFVILQYGGALLGPALVAFNIPFVVFWDVTAALFLALVTWKGLYIRLGGIGVFLTTVLGALVAVSVLYGAKLPISPQQYWFTTIGSFMAIFAAMDRT